MAVKEKYINPFTDFGFKKLFGTELNKDLLIDFLNEVILPQQKRISDLKYRSNEHMGQTELDRKVIFDLYCISSHGERFIVEKQNKTISKTEVCFIPHFRYKNKHKQEIGTTNYLRFTQLGFEKCH